ncbi:kinesin-like protein [Phytophthora infestans T30-4]|uniref:Kinesin-like protein n=1 Tax=Phytophthora infestans (strain T30-4) TaxID=403677 RepID=D0P1F3_PHYIT|nr:kinesin-like protein [Phytophthora infestans T30-4]EEY54187.1 kinesin-like protein [Phytophthora infestans T30-4]|eukprot:XP_002895881.1 kinesin-like protein [Phytophthora infestans T30-4]
MHGFNVTVLAYGQTGSGERARSSSQHGGRQASGAKLTIHEDDQDVWVEGLQQVEVKSVNEALDLLRTGRQRQTVGAHALNDQSSRSHAVYTLEVSRTFNNEIKRAKLTFVDLAGSERAKKTLQEGHGMKEGSHINTLGNVINALGSRQRSLQLLNSPRVSSRGTGSGNVTPRHVPYRSSKLTRLLRDALGGNSVTLFIENATIHSISEKYSPRLSSKREDGSLSRRVMIDQATQYEPLCPQHERKTLIDYVLLSPSEIFREVHNQKKLEGAPSPWPHRRRQDNESSVSKAKSQSRSKTRDVLHDLLQCTRQLVENSPVFGDFDRNPEVQDPSRKEEQSPLSFDTFVNRMTALYDQRSRQHQFVHRLQQRFRHLASLLAVANADNQVNELSKYTLDHQFDQLQQQLSRFERLAADRLWTRLQNREVAIENYTAVWNDQMAEVFLSDDQYEACRPWHPHREDHGFFQHRILPFILSGWISVTPSDLDNEQLWLAL